MKVPKEREKKGKGSLGRRNLREQGRKLLDIIEHMRKAEKATHVTRRGMEMKWNETPLCPFESNKT